MNQSSFIKLSHIKVSLIFLFASCSQNKIKPVDSQQIAVKVNCKAESDSNTIKDSSQFERFVVNYTQTQIDLSIGINDSLKKYDLSNIFKNVSNYTKERWVTILLLKQYVYHISNDHQGYNLLDMRNGDTKIIIDEFIRINNLSSEKEFLNSGYVYHLVKKTNEFKNDTLINHLILKIDSERRKLSLIKSM